jgi:hypothetical protein
VSKRWVVDFTHLASLACVDPKYKAPTLYIRRMYRFCTLSVLFILSQTAAAATSYNLDPTKSLAINYDHLNRLIQVDQGIRNASNLIEK